MLSPATLRCLCPKLVRSLGTSACSVEWLVAASPHCAVIVFLCVSCPQAPGELGQLSVPSVYLALGQAWQGHRKGLPGGGAVTEAHQGNRRVWPARFGERKQAVGWGRLESASWALWMSLCGFVMDEEEACCARPSDVAGEVEPNPLDHLGRASQLHSFRRFWDVSSGPLIFRPLQTPPLAPSCSAHHQGVDLNILHQPVLLTLRFLLGHCGGDPSLRGEKQPSLSPVPAAATPGFSHIPYSWPLP